MAVQAGAQNGPPPADVPADARPAPQRDTGPGDRMGRGGRQEMDQRGDRGQRGDRRGDRRQPPQFSAEDRAAFFDARLAALRAGLRLNVDQDRLWPPVESAVRDLVKTMADLREKARAPAPATPASPFERMKSAGEASSARGGALTRMADAAQPLWAALTDEQKRRFRMLSGSVMGAAQEGMLERGRDPHQETGRGQDRDDRRESGRGRDRDDRRESGRGRDRDDRQEGGRGRDRDDRRDGDRGRMMRRGDVQSPSMPVSREAQQLTDGQEARFFRLGSMGPVDRVYP